MPKQKTHKGVKKRFRLTATGKVKHRQAGTSQAVTSADTPQTRTYSLMRLPMAPVTRFFA